jgi:teichoic acid transport system permease protein
MADVTLAEPRATLSPAELAGRHGLHVAGARPKLASYGRQLWAYRHFIREFASAKLASSFTTARLGNIWQVLTPLANAGVYYLIFGVVLNSNKHIDNFIGYLCTGIFLFSFSQTVIANAASVMKENLNLIRALHFPRAVLPIASTLAALQQMIATTAVLFAIILLSGESPALRWLMIFPSLLLQAIFTAGLAMVMARIGAKIPDLKQILPFVLRTWLYASGIIYSAKLFVDHLPGQWVWLAKINPLLVYTSLGREALMDKPGSISSLSHLWLAALAWALVAGVGGFIFFWRGEQEYGRG